MFLFRFLKTVNKEKSISLGFCFLQSLSMIGDISFKHKYGKFKVKDSKLLP